MTEQQHIRWAQGADGVVVLVMDAPGTSANTMGPGFVDALEQVVDRLEAGKDALAGVVLTSAKRTFFAGGDLHELIRTRPEDAARTTAEGLRTKRLLRRLETLGRPVVAAINGTALGGGLEIALACHHRIVLRDPATKVGLPEATLGLLPGAGGVLRTVRMLGVVPALTQVLLEGRSHRADDAVEIGLVDEAVDTAEELLDRARRWVHDHPDAVQPWDRPGFTIPGGAPSGTALTTVLPVLPARLRKQAKGPLRPAQRNILCAAVECAQVDVDNAAVVETRYFTELATGQTAKNLTKAFFFDLNSVTSGGSRPQGHPTWAATRVGVLGAGLMGAGIAHVCATAGLDVVLKDVTTEAAEKGRRYSARILDRAVEEGRRSRAAADEVLARIRPTVDPRDLAGCDLVIEAVFEDTALKQRVFAEIEDVVAPGCLLASNTSTLPITGLARGIRDQENVIGLHFFSPVERMPLLEIVVGERTSDAALARAFDVARRIGKTPIVVNDARGFFTSRVIGRFVDEALAMVGEGVAAASVEQAALQAGYPIGPLALLDDLTLTLNRKVRQETEQAHRAEGRPVVRHPGAGVVDRMIDELDRPGRPAGRGFYDYASGRRVGLWPGLVEAFGCGRSRPPLTELQERMLFSEALDAVRCLEEGVLRSVADGNVGSLLGIGFPRWTGGVLQYVDQYEGGPAGFLARSRELAERYGERFAPPRLLVGHAGRGEPLARV